MSSWFIRRANISAGGSEPTPRLPDTFRELAYIQGSGTQWINTGLYQQTGDEVGIVYQQVTLDSTYRNIFGASSAGGNNTLYISQTSSETWIVNKSVSSFPRDYNKHSLTWTISNASPNSIIVDGQSYSCPSGVTPSSSLTVKVFARNSNQGKMSGKIYSFYMKRNGDYIINLVPAKRKADDVVGMYDLVSDTFLTNAGSGTFSYGEL